MGEVDAWLAPQLRQLLSAGQNEMAAMKPGTSKQITNHKVRNEYDVDPLGDVAILQDFGNEALYLLQSDELMFTIFVSECSLS
jgi:hypothetical protein